MSSWTTWRWFLCVLFHPALLQWSVKQRKTSEFLINWPSPHVSKIYEYKSRICITHSSSFPSCQASEKGMGIYFTWVFIPEEMSGKWCGQWPMPHYGHSLWCVLHHHTLMLLCDVLVWKNRQKPHHGENGGRVAKTGGLDNAYTSAKRSAMIYRRNTITYLLIPLLQKCFVRIKI